MGAWGYGLFESDDDFEIAETLSDLARLPKLTWNQPPTEEPKTIAIVLHTTPNGKKYVGRQEPGKSAGRLSVYGPFNASSGEASSVRDHLDKGMLQELVDKYTAKYFDAECKDHHPPEYVLCILGACAMTLGCILTPTFKAQLVALRNTALHIPQAQQQLTSALITYENGISYDFRAVSLHKAMTSRKADQDCKRGNMGMNVGGQFTMFGPGPADPKDVAEVRRKMEKIRDGVEGEDVDEATDEMAGTFNALHLANSHPRDACGKCGSKEGKDGGELRVCSKCKERSYCSRKCQKAHWEAHKGLCKKSCKGKGGVV